MVGLGRSAKSASPPSIKSQKLRAARYDLLAVARRVLSGFGLRQGLDYGWDVHRTASCSTAARDNYVGLIRHADGRADYAGVVTCGSVWSCPVCANKIQEVRRAEVCQAMEWAYANGFKCVMITLTFPHQWGDDLKQLLALQAKAFRKLRGGKAWTKLRQRYGQEGLIRSLEITHGQNGWHPHTHEIWIVDAKADAQALQDEITDRWIAACQAVGLSAPEQEWDHRLHGVDVMDNASSSDYMSKQNHDGASWGADHEATKTSSKAARGKSRSPFQILASAAENSYDAKLYTDYTFALKGRAQLFWSRGLKARVLVPEVSDQDLADGAADNAETKEQGEAFYAVLDLQQWWTVVHYNAQALLRTLAENGGEAAITAWFDAHPPPRNGRRPDPPDPPQQRSLAGV